MGEKNNETKGKFTKRIVEWIMSAVIAVFFVAYPLLHLLASLSINSVGLSRAIIITIYSVFTLILTPFVILISLGEYTLGWLISISWFFAPIVILSILEIIVSGIDFVIDTNKKGIPAKKRIEMWHADIDRNKHYFWVYIWSYALTVVTVYISDGSDIKELIVNGVVDTLKIAHPIVSMATSLTLLFVSIFVLISETFTIDWKDKMKVDEMLEKRGEQNE